MSTDAEIIAKVAARAADPKRRIDLEVHDTPPQPLSEPDFLTGLERDLGFALPSLLKTLYLEVGDGGFGPGCGMFGARSGHWLSDEPFTLAETYHVNHKGNWPDKLVPICDWGCAIFGCIDCASGEYLMVTSDPNEYLTEFWPEGISFRDWIEAWADGVDVTPRS